MIPLFKVLMTPEAGESVGDVLKSGHIAQGPLVDEFETRLAATMDLAYGQEVVTTNSGTSAIHLALVLAGVGPDDDVAVSPMTCAATIAPILHLGARPLWIDIDSVTGLMDPQSLHWRLTSKTTAIVAIDWAGTPCDYAAIHKVADGIPVIQDAAHAFLARKISEYNNDCVDQPIGQNPAIYAPNHFVCHSFQAIKHLTTGDGGALITPEAHSDRARRLRWFGLDRRSSKDFRCAQNIDEPGYKFHMNDIAAAIGLANLDAARDAVGRHRQNAEAFNKNLAGLAPRVVIPPWHPGSSWWIYTLIVDDRDAFIKYMASWGIETSQVHRRNDEHTAFKRAAGWQNKLEGLDQFAAHQISIPCGWWVDDTAQGQIIAAVRGYANR